MHDPKAWHTQIITLLYNSYNHSHFVVSLNLLTNRDEGVFKEKIHQLNRKKNTGLFKYSWVLPMGPAELKNSAYFT